MKILVIGDVHGRNYWQKYVNDNFDCDLIIFVGDYVDSHDKNNIEIYNNLMNIIEYKKNNINKVILLLGNHDIQYMLSQPNYPNNPYGCSGYRPEVHFDLYDIFNQNKELFQACYQVNNIIFSHAGITQEWFDFRFHGLAHMQIDNQINEAFKYKDVSLFDVGYRRGGRYNTGGIFWADKYDLIIDPLKNFKQIVGHTAQNEITVIDDIIFCDTGDIMIPRPLIIEI